MKEPVKRIKENDMKLNKQLVTLQLLSVLFFELLVLAQQAGLGY